MFVYTKVLKFLDIIDMQNKQKCFKAKINNIFHKAYGVLALSHQNLSAWALKFPPSQKSVYVKPEYYSQWRSLQ